MHNGNLPPPVLTLILPLLPIWLSAILPASAKALSAISHQAFRVEKSEVNEWHAVAASGDLMV